LRQGRYKAILIDSVAYRLTCMRYIELNSVRAGMASHPSEYRWSSYAANARRAENPLVIPHAQYRTLGRFADERQSAYWQLFRRHLQRRRCPKFALRHARPGYLAAIDSSSASGGRHRVGSRLRLVLTTGIPRAAKEQQQGSNGADPLDA